MSPLVFVANIEPPVADAVVKSMTMWMKNTYENVKVSYGPSRTRLIEITIDPGQDTTALERDSIRNKVMAVCKYEDSQHA